MIRLNTVVSNRYFRKKNNWYAMNQQRKSYDIKNQYLTVVDHAVLKEIRPLATGNDLVLYAEPL